MGLISKLAKGGLAKKAIAEAKKPANQAKAKQFAANVRAKRGGGGVGGGGAPRP